MSHKKSSQAQPKANQNAQQKQDQLPASMQASTLPSHGAAPLLDNPVLHGAASTPPAAKPEGDLPPPPEKVKASEEVPPQPVVLNKGADGVETAADVKDPGTPERHNQGTSMDDGGGKGEVTGKVGGVAKTTVVTDKGIARVFKNQTTLDLLLKNETITQEQYDAGLMFMDAYAISNKYPLRAVSFDAVRGGKVSREDFLQMQIDASILVEEWIKMIGGEQSPGAKALIYVLGKGGSINELFTYTGYPYHYWRGAIVQGLAALSAYLIRGRKDRKKADNKSSQ